RVPAAPLPGSPRGGARRARAGGRRAGRAGRGASGRGGERRAVLRGRALPAGGRAVADPGASGRGRRGSLFPGSAGDRTPTAGALARAARGHEPRASLAAAREARGGSTGAFGDVRLVHRGARRPGLGSGPGRPRRPRLISGAPSCSVAAFNVFAGCYFLRTLRAPPRSGSSASSPWRGSTASPHSFSAGDVQPRIWTSQGRGSCPTKFICIRSHG